MVQYATASDLANFLQIDPASINTITANLVLTLASGEFSRAADAWWVPQTTTYKRVGTYATQLVLPFDPVTAVSAVRINGVTVTGYTLIVNTLYRPAGFGLGVPNINPPDSLEVDLTYGYASVADDVKGAVLDMGAQVYMSPDSGVVSEQIDDYAVRRRAESGEIQLTPKAQKLADSYRVPAVA